MTILRSMLGQPRAGLESPATPITTEGILDILGPGASSSGAVVTEERAVGLSAVWRAGSTTPSNFQR